MHTATSGSTVRSSSFPGAAPRASFSRSTGVAGRSFRGVALTALALAGLWSSSALGQVAKVVTKLNEPWSRILDETKSWKPILTAALDITEAPTPIPANFDLTGIWPGMDKWSDWSAWSEKNQGIVKVLIAQQDRLAFAMPYGEDKIDQALRSKGFATVVNLETEGKRVTFGYFKAIAAINAFVVADMYRLGQAGKFDEAFAVGVANIKLLRQIADQTMLEEKLFALDSLSTCLSIHRDFVYTYLDKIPADVLTKVASKDYPLIRPQDGERFRRLEMPEGDRFVAEGILERCFDDRGQPSEALFAEVFAGLQSQDAPLTRFGAARRWAKIASLHGSLDASTKKLNDVYDDWWRRWRYRPYDPATMVPTELSQLNSIRYAAILLSVIDIGEAFKARLRAAADLNGTATAFAMCAYKRANGTWPDDIEKAFPIFGLKKANFDPYDTEFGSLLFKDLGADERRIETPQGTVPVSGCIVYSRGANNQDDGAKTSDPTADAYDVLYWPPLRAISRSSKG